MGLYAITPYGVGKPVGWRSIAQGWPLATGETFTYPADQPDNNLVLGQDQMSLVPGVDLIAYAAAARYNTEVRGFTTPNGKHITSDATSQTKIAGIKNGYSLGVLTKPVRYKAINGWYTVDEDEINDIYDSVVYHVQACYKKESDVVAGINNGTITTRQQIDNAFATIPMTPVPP